MAYTVERLARMAGISARTLRYYDEIGLLSPARVADNGYRLYDVQDVDALQHILFYRELGFGLAEINRLMTAPDFDRAAALEAHLAALTAKKQRLEVLMRNVAQSIEAIKGDAIMNDNEKFEGFKQALIDDNERQYGAEIRETYGDAAIDAANAKLQGMNPAQWRDAQALSEAINEGLRSAVRLGDAASAEAQRVCDLHRQWLCLYWREGAYSPQAHLSLGEMYVGDARFTAYYDTIAPGAAAFLYEALKIYCADGATPGAKSE